MPKGGSRRDANEKCGEIEKQVRHEVFIAPKKMPLLLEVADNWLKAKESNIRHSTFNQYKGHVDNHLKPFFERYMINQVNFDAIEKFKSDRLKHKVTPPTLRKLLITLGQILRYAVRCRYIDFNPMGDVEKPKDLRSDEKKKKMVSLEPERLQALFNASDTKKDRVLFMSAVFTGMREGELFGLKWTDIDWINSQIHVKRTYKHRRFYEPKSEASKRSIDVAPELVKELKEWRLACPRNELDLVFPSEVGTPEDASNFLKRRFFPALVKAKLPKIRFHDLRHTYAALVWEQTKDVKYLQTQLGHSSIKMTMDVYGHLMNKTNQDAATRLGRAIFGDDCSKTVAESKKEVEP
jgi:integrase